MYLSTTKIVHIQATKTMATTMRQKPFWIELKVNGDRIWFQFENEEMNEIHRRDRFDAYMNVWEKNGHSFL